MAIKTEDDGGYEFVKVTVRLIDEDARIEYQIDEEGAPRGGDTIDDPSVVTWSDQDIKQMAADMLGITEGVDEIEVIWD